MKTTLLLDQEPVADGGWVVRALLKLEGKAPAREGRVPLNLSLVLDRSGSMTGAKLAAAKEAARLLVRRLWPEDRVSVVVFGSRVHTIAPPATADGHQDVAARIGAIGTEGMTNLSGGWLKGRDHVVHHFRAGGVNRIVLLTDGLANQGITDSDRLCGLCSAAAANGVTTSTIGFGTDFNEDLLIAMADAGGGNAYYIEHPDQAPGIFEEELQGLLSIAAQNLSVRIAAARGAQFVAVHHSYPAHADGRALVVEIGDLYAREPRLLLAEFLVEPGAAGQAVPVAELTLSAQVLTAKGGVQLETLRLPITVSTTAGARVEPEVRREMLLLEAARVRNDAVADRERGDFDGASRKLREVADKLRAAGLSDATLREEADDLAGLSDRFVAHSVGEADLKYLKQRYYDSMRSRRSSSERISRTRREDQS